MHIVPFASKGDNQDTYVFPSEFPHSSRTIAVQIPIGKVPLLV